ncbi:MAG: 4-hydroxy-tetrahydrodipicolinate synthase [Euryarchaeota archaeon]|nr:4-hydroxy-tetrahydrodipicolinate synthase [Euryarchaeota archaeon]
MFEGCFTAIVTPFRGNGLKPELDEDAFTRLVELQNEAGVAGIVAVGTTGESPVLSHEEHRRVVELTVEHARCAVIAGTGSNCTWEALELSRHAGDVGAAATLQVCPYYNKPSQEGLFRHFSTIAECVDIPHILYNIPGRSALEIAPETMARLREEHSNIVGVKEASGNPETWRKIRELCGEDFLILSGNDGDTFALMRDFSAKGVISVASNIIPKRMQRFVELGLRGEFAAMEREHLALRELFDVLFIDTNPIPIKEAMSLAGMPAGGFRLPLCETSEEKRERIREVIRRLGII